MGAVVACVVVRVLWRTAEDLGEDVVVPYEADEIKMVSREGLARVREATSEEVSRIFPENHASRALHRRVGFREVGVYQRHGRLDGIWRDCVIVEQLLGEAAAG